MYGPQELEDFSEDHLLGTYSLGKASKDATADCYDLESVSSESE